MSEKKDQEYFSDGLSEELIDMLTKAGDLRVPARTSSFYFKGRQTTIADIARMLRVAHVVEGSVRKSGNRLRVTAQLVRADNGYQLWSKTYDRKLDDIFKVQDEIAAAVARELKASLLAGDALATIPATNMEAYSLRLQARYFRLRGERGDIDRALALFRKSVQLEPDSAASWAELARALYAYSAGWQRVTWKEGREEVLGAVEHALSLDSRLAEAHVVLALVKESDWDWEGARLESAKVRAIDPYNIEALLQQGSNAESFGDLPGAIRLYQAAAARDPLNHFILAHLTGVYISAGRLADAEAAARKSLELSPDGLYGPLRLGDVLVRRGQTEAGLAEIAREPDEQARNRELAWVYQYLGRRTEADAALAQMEGTCGNPCAYSIASIHALRHEPDLAFAWLDRAYQQHDFNLGSVLIDRDFASLRGDPRYGALLRRLNLPG